MFERLLEPLQSKWDSLSARDQKAGVWLIIALAVSIILFGIIIPLNQRTNDLRQSLNSAENIYDELLMLAPQAMANSGGQAASMNVNSLNSEIRRQAARYGVEIQRFEPDGQALRVWLEDARYPSVVQWLGALEMFGIVHLDLTLEDRPRAGFVSARVTFGVSG